MGNAENKPILVYGGMWAQITHFIHLTVRTLGPVGWSVFRTLPSTCFFRAAKASSCCACMYDITFLMRASNLHFQDLRTNPPNSKTKRTFIWTWVPKKFEWRSWRKKKNFFSIQLHLKNRKFYCSNSSVCFLIVYLALFREYKISVQVLRCIHKLLRQIIKISWA